MTIVDQTTLFLFHCLAVLEKLANRGKKMDGWIALGKYMAGCTKWSILCPPPYESPSE